MIQENWKKGLILSLVTVFCWSTLPVALKISLQAMDAMTLTWVRFVSAALITLVLLLTKNNLSQFKKLNHKDWFWLGLAALMLIGNYVFFLIGLEMTTPGNAQVFIQMAPLLMTIGGVIIFKESFNKAQMVGALSIIVGLILFFRDQIQLILKSDFTLGIWVMFVAALTWAIYALIQKHLARRLSSQAILLFIYVFASLALVFFSDFGRFTGISQVQWWAIAYACINTVFAYGAFAEALNHWNASRVGMVLAITPVTTLLVINLFAIIMPDMIDHEQIQTVGYIGMAFIVTGSMLASLKK